MEKKFKVSLYIRVSTGKQASEGESLEEQEKELRKFCEFKNFLIHRTHIERGKSAKDTNRPEYQALLSDVKAKLINAVIVKKLDRLSRSLLDFEDFMLIAQNNDVEFISLKENFDTTNAMGKAMLRVALVFAQLEREQTSERIKDVMDYLAEKGIHNTRPPYGYDRVEKALVPHKQEKKIVEIIYNKFIETRSTVAVAKLLNDAGHRNRSSKRWDCRRILDLIKNPVYSGQVVWGGKQYPGLHQPLVSEKTFDQAQMIFKKKGRNFFAQTHNLYLLQGLLVCGHCQRTMTPSFAYNNQKNKYFYYRCASSSANTGQPDKVCIYKYVAVKKIEERVLTLLLSLGSEKQFNLIENKILKHNQVLDKAAEQVKAEVTNLLKKLETIKTSKDRFLDSLIAHQYLSLERKKINDKLEELEQEEKQTKALLYKKEFEFSQSQSNQIDLTGFKEKLVTFRKDYDSLDSEQIKERVQSLFRKIAYFHYRLILHFHLLPWPLEFEDQKVNNTKVEKSAIQPVLA